MPPVLVAPRPGEPLLLYVAATNQVVSAVLVVEREDDPEPDGPGSSTGGCPAQPAEEPPREVEAVRPGNEVPALPGKRRKVQRPVYFISTVLRDARERYPDVQKLLLGVLLASRKLRHYFQAHRVTVPTSFGLGSVLRNRNATGRVAEWAAELAEFDLHFVHATAVKSQVLADFAAEWTNTQVLGEDPLSSLPGSVYIPP